MIIICSEGLFSVSSRREMSIKLSDVFSVLYSDKRIQIVIFKNESNTNRHDTRNSSVTLSNGADPGPRILEHL